MLILGVTSPQGDEHYVAAAFPSACGKTNFAMLMPTASPAGRSRPSATTSRGCKPRRRRAAVRDQSRGRLLRRRAGHQREDRTRTRWTTLARNTIFTNVALTADGDVWWEGMTDEPPAGAHRLAGQRLDARSRGRKAAHPNARFTAPAAQCPSIAPRVGGSRRRADLRDHLRRPPRDDGAARRPGARLGSTACSSARPWPRRRPPPRPARSACCAATRSRCCRSAATTWATTSRTGSTMASAVDASLPRIFQRQLVPQGRGRASSCGPASARTCACSSGSSSAAKARRRRSRRRSACSRPRDARPRVSISRPAHLEELLRVDVAGWRAELPHERRAPTRVRRSPAGRARRRAHSAARPPRLSARMWHDPAARGSGPGSAPATSAGDPLGARRHPDHRRRHRPRARGRDPPRARRHRREDRLGRAGGRRRRDGPPGTPLPDGVLDSDPPHEVSRSRPRSRRRSARASAASTSLCARSWACSPASGPASSYKGVRSYLRGRRPRDRPREHRRPLRRHRVRGGHRRPSES